MFGRKQPSDIPVAPPQQPLVRPAVAAPPSTGEAPLPNAEAPVDAAAEAPPPAAAAEPSADGTPLAAQGPASEAYEVVRNLLFTRINVSAAVMTSRENLRKEIEPVVMEIVQTERLRLNTREIRQIIDDLLNDMFGVGPIESLLGDESITDIMVNGPHQVYVERRGRLELTAVRFRDNQHVVNVAQRIAAAVGRRVDESSPIVDARLADGSRVNVILPPLALRGPAISIRKFARNKPSISKMVQQGNISAKMGRVLELASASRLNILISGGTGSGKTTMMNALSRVIDHRERVVTIEDAAELQLQQPHVVSLESRPSNSEGLGEVTLRDLLKNALRMRPDRIILGETRGEEAFDVLQAMNTGHDGSMSTIHANSPRDALVRLENMVLMGSPNQPMLSIRRQISSAVNMIVHLERMRDGKRRVTHVTEVAGMEGEIIATQDLFIFDYDLTRFTAEEVLGTFKSTGVRPAFYDKASYFGQGEALLEAMRP